MSDSGAFDAAVSAMSRFFVGDATVEQTLLAVSELAVQAIPGADFAGMSLWGGRLIETRAYTDVESVEIDRAQYETGEGPCLDAMRNEEVYRVDRMEDDQRWPAFAERCLAHGVHSTLSLPLSAGGVGVGALNLYSRSPEAFIEAEAAAQVFALSASTVIANAQAYWNARQLSVDMSEAMASRASIEQAKGILMAQSHVSAEAAFELMVSASKREGRKLRALAEGIVEGTKPGPA